MGKFAWVSVLVLGLITTAVAAEKSDDDDLQLSVFARFILESPGKPYSVESDSAYFALYGYQELRSEIGRDGSRSQAFEDFINRDSATVAQEMRNRWHLSNTTRYLGERTVQVIQAFHHTLSSPGEKEFFSRMSALGATLDVWQRLMLVRMYGSQFEAAYEDARADQIFEARGPRTLGEMLAAANSNYGAGFHSTYDDDLNYELYMTSGVCRDIASAQGQMLQALGFRDTYIISYAAAGSGLHSAVITRDPTNPQTVYRMNYDAISSASDRFGPDAINQGEFDVGMNYFISKPAGEVVADIPSEMGKFMAQASGFDVRTLDPMARLDGHMISAKAALSRKSEFRVFYGTDANGASYMGVATALGWAEQSLAPGKIAFALASQARPLEKFGTYENTGLEVFYMHLEQWLKTKDYSMSWAPLRARIEAVATALFYASRMREGWYDKQLNASGDFRLTAGVRIEQGKDDNGEWKDRFQASYFGGVQVVPGIKDVRDIYWKQVPIFPTNHLILSAEGRYRLSQSKEGRAYLLAAMAVLHDHFGNRARADLGAAVGKFSAVASVEGRLNDDMAPYKDGVERRLYATLTFEPLPAVQLGLQGYRSLEKNPAEGRVYGLHGTVNVKAQ